MYEVIEQNDIILKDLHYAMYRAVMAMEDYGNNVELCKQMLNVYMQLESVLAADQKIIVEKCYSKFLQPEADQKEANPAEINPAEINPAETNPPEEKQEAKAEADDKQTAKKPAKKKAK